MGIKRELDKIGGENVFDSYSIFYFFSFSYKFFNFLMIFFNYIYGDVLSIILFTYSAEIEAILLLSKICWE